MTKISYPTLFLSCLFIILSLFSMCGPKQDEVERRIEEGVEVVINFIEPYVIADKPFNLKVKRTVLIDFESGRITELGIADIRDFDIDSDGNIYVSVFKGDYCIHKFDSNGKFLISFGRKGQGPGEFFVARSLSTNDKNEIMTDNSSKQNYMIFDSYGFSEKENG